MDNQKSALVGNVLLLSFATTIWGIGFVATKWTLVLLDPFWSQSFRFLTAAILGLPFLFYKNTFFKKDSLLKEACVGGILISITLILQTIGLTHTTVAKSGFITTLYVLFIPIISTIMLKKKYKKHLWGLVLLSLVGMALLCNFKISEFNIGDKQTLVCSLVAALHILYIGQIAHKIKSPIEFNFLQNIVVAFFSVLTAIIFHKKMNASFLFDWQSRVFYGVLFLGVFSSMMAFSIQIVAQKKIPVHIAGLVFLLESPLAAFFGYLFLDEKLAMMNIVGAILILFSVLLVPFVPKEVTV